MSEFQVLNDVVAWIRLHPERFFAGGVVTAQQLLVQVVRDAIVQSALPVTVDRVGRWWIVVSNHDWLEIQDDQSIVDLFQKLIPLPVAGPECHRTEVLLTAFARSVVTATPKGIVVVKGSADGLMEYLGGVQLFGANGRVVAFTFD